MIPMTLQVQIRPKSGGDVSLDDCAKFSAPMGEAIEDSDLIKEPYVLEISSQGISESLDTDRDFQTFHGFPVEVSFRNEKNAEIQLAGLLHERSENHVLLNIKGRIKKIPRKDVIYVRLTSPKV